MKVIILLDSRGFGGIESHVLQLAQGLTQHQHHAEIWLLRDHGPHPLMMHLNQQGITLDYVNGGAAALFYKLQNQPKCVVHSHGYKAGILARVVCKMLKIPCFSTYHAGEKGHGRLALYQWLDNHMAWLASQTYAVSAPIKERLLPTCKLLNNFIHLPPPRRQNGLAIGFVGRLSAEKAPERMITLARCLPQQQCLIYGDGPLYQRMAQQAPVNLRLQGEQHDMEPAWQQLQLLIICSKHEGLPMVAIEAMARGIIVIAFDLGALGSLIESGENGWLIPGQDIQDIVSKIKHWLSLSETEQTKMKMCARARVEQHFSTDAVVPQLMQDYQNAF